MKNELQLEERSETDILWTEINALKRRLDRVEKDNRAMGRKLFPEQPEVIPDWVLGTKEAA